MKKLMLGIAVAGMIVSFGSIAFADVQCGQTDLSGHVVACGNGPIQPQIPGGRFLKAGEEDCPVWFPSMFGHACYTMRAVGAFYYPLNK